MTGPQSPIGPGIQSPPGLMVGTVYAKPVKNRGNNYYGYRVGSAA